jgi:hypothetical protein
MRLPKKIFWSCLLLYNLLTLRMQAQPAGNDRPASSSPAPDSISPVSITPAPDPAYTDALRQYHAYLSPETGLYRGTQYVKYSDRLKEGHPYFEENRMQNGTVLYNGILYSDLFLLFDLVKGLLVINDPYNTHTISLISEQVDRFTIGQHVFLRLRDSLNPSAPANGFYEQLYSGRSLLLKKEEKAMRKDESVVDGVQWSVTSEVHYYLRKGTVYYAVDNKKSLLYALKDRNKEARKFMRGNGLDLRRDTDDALLKVLAWYDGLNP